MRRRTKSARGFRWFVMPALVLTLIMPAFASVNQARTGTSRSNPVGNKLVREVRHQLLMLPFYGVFDNLTFRVVENGEVELMGEVVRPTLKGDAGAVVRRIAGVTKVINHIRVLPVSPFDNRIRKAEYREIYRTTGFEKYAIRAVPPIHIIVDNGDVTLVGVVANKTDKNLAGFRANMVHGVFQVTNDLRISHNG
jgi:hyperosmotically inducible periplasmic protein